MYGNVNRKKKKDGTLYKDYFYYACKHRRLVDGHKCGYRKQWSEEKINNAVEEVIRKLVKNPKFEEAILNKIGSRIDTEEIEKEIERLEKQHRQLTGAKARLGQQMDSLDIMDKFYEKKYQDMETRLYRLYDEIEGVENSIEEVKNRLLNIQQQKISEENVYQFLLYFDKLYDKFTDLEKKEFLNSFVEQVDIYEQEQPDGRFLKHIKFRFPVYFGDRETQELCWDNESTVDTSDGTTKFNIGDENTSTNQYYISKDDDDSTVYVVAADTVTPFMKSLYDYAQGEDFPTIDSSTVKKVQVSEDKDSYVLEENSDGATWDVSSDGSSDKETADTTAAGNVTSGLGNFAYDQFVNYNAEDLSQYGLDKPYATITVDYQEEVKDDSSDSTDSSEKDSTASESDSESVDSTDDKASAENSSTDSSDSTDASDDSSSSEDTKTTTVDKQLVIYVGDEASDGSRYVTVDNKHIYTMSADTLSAVIDKAPSDLWSLIVNYLSVKNLDQLQVTYGGATNTVNVSRETSKDDDGNDKETTTYQLDGKEIESTTFTTFYNKLINMAGQKRLTDAYTPATDPEMTAVFTDSDKNQTTVTFYTYDTNYYAAVVGNKVFLVNKMTVKEMFNAYETLINSESKTKATATPTAEAEK